MTDHNDQDDDELLPEDLGPRLLDEPIQWLALFMRRVEHQKKFSSKHPAPLDQVKLACEAMGWTLLDKAEDKSDQGKYYFTGLSADLEAKLNRDGFLFRQAKGKPYANQPTVIEITVLGSSAGDWGRRSNPVIF